MVCLLCYIIYCFSCGQFFARRRNPMDLIGLENKQRNTSILSRRSSSHACIRNRFAQCGLFICELRGVFPPIFFSNHPKVLRLDNKQLCSTVVFNSMHHNLDAAMDRQLFALLLFASVRQTWRFTSEKKKRSPRDNQSPQIHDFCSFPIHVPPSALGNWFNWKVLETQLE